ncbi:B3 domain-containing protein REM19-like [Humulus lupulus]|uniref:B3 domain-containing protein REM19-like n=1 Tax=Humulus lupulus TaxID=3486 RepID=UPI002B4098AB|nr:B3 domain-containing protein REM19-like [Humulus lupulus]
MSKVQIPKAFWVKYCGSLSSQVYLKLPCGSRWEVGLTKTDGKFNVIIFDKTIVEIDYPSNHNNFGKHYVETDVCIDVLGSYPKARDKPPLPCSRPNKKMKTNPYVMKWDFSDKVCGDSPLPRWMEPEYFLRKQKLNAKEIAEALKRAKGFKSKDPFFMICMRPSFVVTKLNMIIPSVFAKHYLLSTNNSMKLISEVNTGNQGTCKRPSSSGLSRASEAANQFFSKNPYFQVILRSNHVLGCVLHIPCTFGVHYFEEKTQTVMLWVGEKYWYVKLLAYKSDFKFSAWWAAFAKGNSLQPRDVCIFELIKRNQSKMKVYIFRQSGLAQE